MEHHQNFAKFFLGCSDDGHFSFFFLTPFPLYPYPSLCLSLCLAVVSMVQPLLVCYEA